MLIVGIAFAALAAGAISAVMYAIKRADYGTLFSNLTAEDASSITQKLKEDKVPYALGDGGATVRVPSDMVAEERVALAGAGIVHGGSSGYELFDRMNLGMTEFEEKIDKTRAVEGELERTIAGLAPVAAARVHLASPDPSLYSDTQEPVTASIAITTRPGRSLTPGQVRGIVQLVAGAVEGLKPEQVTIVNQDGEMLLPDVSSGDTASNALRLTADQLIAKQRFESHLQQNIQSLLDSTIGPKRVAVRVATDMRFDSETTKSDEYANNPVTRSEQIEKEKYTGGRPGSAAGVPGTTSNVPSYQGAQTGQNGNYSRSKVLRNNEISVIHREHTDAPGRINHTSVAVLVNTGGTTPPGQKATDTYTLTPANVSQIRNVVVAAAGLNLAAGDQVSVEAIPFNPAVMVDDKAGGTTKILGLPVGGAIAVLLIILLAVAGVAAVALRKPSVGGGEMPEGFQSFDDTLKAELPPGDQNPSLLRHGLEGGLTPMLSAEDMTREQMIEYVQSVAHDNPENIAKLIKIWLVE